MVTFTILVKRSSHNPIERLNLDLDLDPDPSLT